MDLFYNKEPMVRKVWKQFYVEKRRVSFMYFIVENRIFYCQRNLWFGAHTGMIGFLNIFLQNWYYTAR